MQTTTLGTLRTQPPPQRVSNTSIDMTRRAATSAGHSVHVQNGKCSSCSDSLQIQVPEKLLFRWNAAMTLFHLSLAVTVLTLGNSSLSVPLYRTSLRFEVFMDGWNSSNKTFFDVQQTNVSNDNITAWRVVPYYEEAAHINITVLTASFFLLSALFHFMNAFVVRDFYLRELSHCRTPTRWIEYTFSAPVMFILIAYSTGVRGRSEIVSTAALIAVTMFFGYWTEREGRPKDENSWNTSFASRILPWALGHIPQIVAWYVVLAQFYDNSWDISRVPWFVHLIVWAEAVLFFSFAVASFLSQLYPPRLFYRGELLFQVLSLVSKGLLGMILITNVLMLSEFEEIYDA